MTPFQRAADVGTGGAMTLPGRCFTSPEVFNREQEKIFLRHWLSACSEAAISQPGDYFVRTLGAESVIILRDSDRSVRAVHNVCRHRGARLCDERQGSFARTIQCPYHAWTYSLAGRLVGAPSMDELPGFDKDCHALRQAEVALWEGFVFLSFTAPPAPFEETYSALAGKFTQYQLPRLRSVRQIDYDVRANWKLILQNYSECYHCPTVHPALVKLSPAESGGNDLVEGPVLGGYMSLVREGGSLTHSGRACGIPVGDLAADDLQRVYYYVIFPNMLLSLHRDYVLLHTLWPLAADHTRVECSWWFHPQAAEAEDFHPEDGIEFWDMTNRQDWHICELTQLGVSSRAYAPGPYAPRDSMAAAFDRHYLAAMGEEA